MNAKIFAMGSGHALRGRLLKTGVAAGLLAAALTPNAWAGSVDLGHGVNLQYTAGLTYTLAVRTDDRSTALIGPKASGSAATVNADDGDRAFARGSIVNNRLGILGSTLFSWHNYGALFRADGFYDNAYQHNNDDIAATVNHTGPYNHFTSEAVNRLGQRVRMLDAYGYAHWHLGGETYLGMRVGRQVVAWGQSLFFSGISTTQGPADAAQSFVPGVQVKNILLPVNQVSMNLGLTELDPKNWTVR